MRVEKFYVAKPHIYASLKRSNRVELIGVKFRPNGLIWPELWPVKVLKICARKWALQSCSGHCWSKIFTAFFSRALLVKISLLLKQSVSPVGRQTPFLAKISQF